MGHTSAYAAIAVSYRSRRAVRVMPRSPRRASVRSFRRARSLVGDVQRSWDEDVDVDMEFDLDLDALAIAFDSDCTSGIPTSDIVNRNREKFGSNAPPPAKMKTAWDFAEAALDDLTIRVLIASGAISLALETNLDTGENAGVSWLNGAAILLAVVIIVAVETGNNLSKQSSFAKLNARNEEETLVSVTRSGSKRLISKNDVVVGDVINLDAGDVNPVDARVIDSSAFLIDKSHITGESEELPASRDEFIYAGSKITSGQGSVLAIAVGKRSSSGRIMELMNMDDGSALTPLQTRLQKLAVEIGRFGIGAAALVGVILAGSLTWNYYTATGGPPPIESLVEYLDIVITAITIVVVSVPEGLPLAVTLALAFSVRQMLQLDMLVRVLSSAETAGEVTTVLTDKTGTLTENKQRVNRAWIAGIDVGPLADGADGNWSSEVSPKLDSRVLKLLSVALTMNSTVQFDINGDIIRGSKSEIALLNFVNNLNGDERFTFLIRKHFPLLRLFPFSAERKRMCSVFTLSDAIEDAEMSDVIVRACVKGASQDVLALCADVLRPDGSRVPLNDTSRSELSQKFESWQKDAQRVLLVAYRDVERDILTSRDAQDICRRLSILDAESRLCLVAAVGMSDPPRPEARQCVSKARSAGVDVKMVTGDSVITAIAVAKQCGILDEDSSDEELRAFAMTGEEFRERVLSDDGALVQTEIDALWPKLRVLARASPQDKYILTDGIRNSRLSRQVVAVVGDGSNDSPALRRSNVGFALGSGTQMAKDASDVVLLRDDFTSVIDAIRFGRNVFESIQKFLTFQITANVSVLAVSTGGALAYAESPFSAIQLLFVNLVIDSLASLALATDEPTDDLLNNAPADSEALITSNMKLNIATQVGYQLLVMTTLMNWFGPSHTVVYNTFVLLQLANQLNCRKVTTEANVLKGVMQNKLFIALISAELLLHILIVQRGGEVFQTSPLDFHEWVLCFVLAFGAIPLRVFVVTFVTSFMASMHREELKLF